MPTDREASEWFAHYARMKPMYYGTGICRGCLSDETERAQHGEPTRLCSEGACKSCHEQVRECWSEHRRKRAAQKEKP